MEFYLPDLMHLERAIMIARPTTSPVIYSQMLGRGLRGPKFGGKTECLVN